MKKKRFFREDEAYNEAGCALYYEAEAAIGPLVAKYAVEGYNIRELQQIIMDYVGKECLFAMVHAQQDFEWDEEIDD